MSGSWSKADMLLALTCPLLARRGHERLRIAAVQLDALHYRFARRIALSQGLGLRRLWLPMVQLHQGFAKECLRLSDFVEEFLVKNSTRPLATATGFLPGKSWLAHGINTVSIFGIHCWSRSAPSKNTGNVSLPRIDSTGCRISFRPSVEIFQCCMAPSST